MLHFMSILTPSPRENDRDEQAPFFGPDWRPSRAERDQAILSGKQDPAADAPETLREDLPMSQRFVTLLAPPFL